MDERQALSLEEAAASCGIGRTLFYDLLRDRTGPPTFRLGRRRLVRVEALRRWLAERETQAEPRGDRAPHD